MQRSNIDKKLCRRKRFELLLIYAHNWKNNENVVMHFGVSLTLIKRRQNKELQAKTTADGFGNDNVAAQKVIQQVNGRKYGSGLVIA